MTFRKGEAMMRDHLCRMARYNRWANRRLYDACETLADDVYHQSRKMFFGSIHGTLNHILVGDRMWLARIEGKPTPTLALDRPLCDDLISLRGAREQKDAHMIELTETYGDTDLEAVISYRTVVQPMDITTPLHLCWLHLFNHQTHHRGQVHDQLSQVEMIPPPLDLIFYLREQA